ncbi:SUR7/PalI family-domain-containing protein [Biscogniauxia marginata]|nr:SUR7/PalI family-domain-containing protein [Biscogniauxia marginata]
MAARRLSWLAWGVTLILLLLTLIFSMIILLSGVNNNVVGEFLKIDTGHLDPSSKLSISVFLDDLSEISDSDYHKPQDGDDEDDDDDDNNDGNDSATKASEKLPTYYSLTLLTLCAHNDDRSTTCAEPRIGFSFDPESHLDLDENDFEEFSEDYNYQLHVYSNISLFLSVAYIVVILITALSCLHLVLAICFPRMLMLSKFFSLVATIFLFVAAITSSVTFIRLKDAFNEALDGVGVHTDIGSSMIGYSFGAFGLSFFAFLTMITQSRGGKEHRGGGGAAARDVEGGKGGLIRKFTAEGQTSARVVGVLNRAATWKGHKYSKVDEKQPAHHHHHHHHHLHHHKNSGSSDDQNALMTAAHDPASSSDSSSREYVEDRGITASPEMRERFRDEDTAYDPPRLAQSPRRG